VNWLKYSGVTISINLNPWHWRSWPTLRSEHANEWGSPWRRWRAAWLMMVVIVYLDDGGW